MTLPERADYSLTESALIPFQAEPTQMLEQNQVQFQEKMVRLAQESGDVSVRKLDSKKTFDTLVGPLDYFFAYWNPLSPGKDQRSEPLGYFYFIDGKFRWDSNVTFMALHTTGQAEPAQISVAVPGRGGVQYPTCSYCPPAESPKGKGHSKVDVVVTLKALILAEGRATNIDVVKSGGQDFDKSAIEAVQRWRFKPAQGPDGVPVAATTTIEIAFNH